MGQAALKIMGNAQVITQACSMGNLELNQYMPIIAHDLLESISILSSACFIFREKCVLGISANEQVCKRNVENSTATATALIPIIGYNRASEIVKLAKEKNISIKNAAIESSYITVADFDNAITPEAVCRLGN